MVDTTATPRLAFRMKPELKQRIEEAAALMGLSVTDFVVTTLAERATQVVERQRAITLSDRDRDRFLEALHRRGRPIPELVATRQRQQRQATQGTDTEAGGHGRDD